MSPSQLAVAVASHPTTRRLALAMIRRVLSTYLSRPWLSKAVQHMARLTVVGIQSGVGHVRLWLTVMGIQSGVVLYTVKKGYFFYR